MMRPFCPGSVYEHLREDRLQTSQLEQKTLYAFMMKLTGTQLEAFCAPASLADIRHRGGSLAVSLSLKKADLRELATTRGNVADGLWTPAVDDPFIISTTGSPTFGVEGYFLEHDELCGSEEMVGTVELALLLELTNA